MKNIAIFGDGGWGTALALVLHKNGHRVRVWGYSPEYIKQVISERQNPKFLPGINLPEEILWTSDPGVALEEADVVVLVVPSKFYRAICMKIKPFISSSCLIVSATKGLDPLANVLMTKVAEEVFGRSDIAVISGPSFAAEVARDMPTAVVLACEKIDNAVALQKIFNNNVFRVYTNTDVIGVELGGALKNVIAIAAGISDGIGLGDNSKAALITRGLSEMTRLGVALGAQLETFFGLSGIGDLIATCTGKLSRNRAVGEKIGRGETLDDILSHMEQVAEGVGTCTLVRNLAHQKHIPTPVIDEVYAVLHYGKNPAIAAETLLSREPKQEKF